MNIMLIVSHDVLFSSNLILCGFLTIYFKLGSIC